MRLDPVFAHERVTVIEPTRGWRMLDWRTYRYASRARCEALTFSAARDPISDHS